MRRILAHPMGPIVEWMVQKMTDICRQRPQAGLQRRAHVEHVANLLEQCDVQAAAGEEKKEADFNLQLAEAMIEACKGRGEASPDHPAVFGAHPTLDPYATDNTRLTLVKTHFSHLIHKFSGDPQELPHRKSIREVLDMLTRAQKMCVLSKEEFLNQLVAVFTGTAYQVVSGWIEDGLTVREIYTRIARLYNRDEKPDVARAKLDELMPRSHGFRSLAEATGEIGRLSILASRRWKDGDYRTASLNSNAIRAFERICPDPVRYAILRETANMTQLVGKNLTFAQVQTIADKFRAEIDKAFAADALPAGLADADRHVANVVGVRSVSREQKEEETPKMGKDGNMVLGSLSCSLCPSLKHSSTDCIWFSEKERYPVAGACKKCDWGKCHPERFCPLVRLMRHEDKLAAAEDETKN